MRKTIIAIKQHDDLVGLTLMNSKVEIGKSLLTYVVANKHRF